MEVIMENTEKKPLPERRTYTVNEIAAILNIGRATAYQLVKEGHFRSIRIGIVKRQNNVYQQALLVTNMELESMKLTWNSLSC